MLHILCCFAIVEGKGKISMTATATMYERGQITIPKQFRNRLGFQPGMVFVFTIEGNSVRMSAKNQRREKLEEARGCLKGMFDDIGTDALIAEMRGR